MLSGVWNLVTISAEALVLPLPPVQHLPPSPGPLMTTLGHDPQNRLSLAIRSVFDAGRPADLSSLFYGQTGTTLDLLYIEIVHVFDQVLPGAVEVEATFGHLGDGLLFGPALE